MPNCGLAMAVAILASLRYGRVMAIELDHTIVPARDQVAAAQKLAEILGVPWAARGMGPFSSVHVNPGLTIDFISTDEPFPIHHCCFRVSPAEYEAIFARLRAAGIPYRSTPHGPVDMQTNTTTGEHNLYWNEPEGHWWEMLFRSPTS